MGTLWIAFVLLKDRTRHIHNRFGWLAGDAYGECFTPECTAAVSAIPPQWQLPGNGRSLAARLLTMIATLPRRLSRHGCSGVSLREFEVELCREVGALYFHSYGPGVAWSTMDESVRDVEAGVEGFYGTLFRRASFTAHLDGAVVGALLTVLDPPWSDVPSGPFIIELFVSPHHRRRGIARSLLNAAAQAAADAGHRWIALRVDPDNRTGLRLYRSFGFEVWGPDAGAS